MQFATLHVVGSNNNLTLESEADSSEFQHRNAANLKWLQHTINETVRQQSRALVIAFHADIFVELNNSPDGLADIRQALKQQLLDLDIPVLMIHGDFHTFILDRPFLSDVNKNGIRGEHIYRLQTFGSPELKGVLIEFDDGQLPAFSVKPVYTATEFRHANETDTH